MLRLRPYKACDAHSIVSWTGDVRAFRQWSADRFDRFPITGEDLDRYYRSFDGSDSFFEMTAFDETGPAGHMIMRFTDEKKSVVRFGFIIVDKRRRGQGLGREMLELAVRYAFEILKAEKITLGVFENNPRAYRCYLSAGFTLSPAETAKHYTILDEDWKCLELQMTRHDFMAAKR